MTTYGITFKVVVEAEDESQAGDEARALIRDPRFEPNEIVVLGPTYCIKCDTEIHGAPTNPVGPWVDSDNVPTCPDGGVHKINP